MPIIFDLDQTLIDSTVAESFRDARKWDKVYPLIPEFKVYPVIDEMIQYLNDKDIGIAVVTSSPRPYCDRVIRHFKWNIPVTVCYHDTIRKKPDPEPIILAMERLKAKGKLFLSVGDQDVDVTASKQAGITCIAALWGTKNKSGLIGSKPDIIVKSPQELFNHIIKEENKL